MSRRLFEKSVVCTYTIPFYGFIKFVNIEIGRFLFFGYTINTYYLSYLLYLVICITIATLVGTVMSTVNSSMSFIFTRHTYTHTHIYIYIYIRVCV